MRAHKMYRIIEVNGKEPAGYQNEPHQSVKLEVCQMCKLEGTQLGKALNTVYSSTILSCKAHALVETKNYNNNSSNSNLEKLADNN